MPWRHDLWQCPRTVPGDTQDSCLIALATYETHASLMLQPCTQCACVSFDIHAVYTPPWQLASCATCYIACSEPQLPCLYLEAQHLGHRCGHACRFSPQLHAKPREGDTIDTEEVPRCTVDVRRLQSHQLAIRLRLLQWRQGHINGVSMPVVAHPQTAHDQQLHLTHLSLDTVMRHTGCVCASCLEHHACRPAHTGSAVLW